jgi:hypothetical protein
MPKIYGVPIWEWVEMSNEERQEAKTRYEEKLKRLKELCGELGVGSLSELTRELRKVLFGRDAAKYLSLRSCGNCVNFEHDTLPDVFWVIENQIRPVMPEGKESLIEELVRTVKSIRDDKQRRTEICKFCKEHLKKGDAEFICYYLNFRRDFCRALRAIVKPDYILPLAGCDSFRPRSL